MCNVIRLCKRLGYFTRGRHRPCNNKGVYLKHFSYYCFNSAYIYICFKTCPTGYYFSIYGRFNCLIDESNHLSFWCFFIFQNGFIVIYVKIAQLREFHKIKVLSYHIVFLFKGFKVFRVFVKTAVHTLAGNTLLEIENGLFQIHQLNVVSCTCFMTA